MDSTTSYWEIAGSFRELPHAERIEALVRSVAEMAVEEIVAFQRFIGEHQAKARTERFLLAATLLYNDHGHYTNEHFNAISAWLVFQGEPIYTRALGNPDSLGPLICDLTAPGDFLTICTAAYERKTRLTNFGEISPHLQEKTWAAREGFVEPEKVKLLFPNLYAKYLVLNQIPDQEMSSGKRGQAKFRLSEAFSRRSFVLGSIGAVLFCILENESHEANPETDAKAPPLPPRPARSFPLTGHSNTIFGLAWSPQGRTLASGSNDGTVKVWDVSAHQCIQTLAARTNGAWAGGIAWSPDGTTLANSADDGTIKLWETKTWKSVGELADKLSSGILSATALSWSPDSRTLYSGYWDHTVRVWDVQHLSGKWAMPEHASVVFGVAVSPNGNLLASGSRDGTVRIWDLVKATWPGDTLADFPKARWPQSPQCVHLFSGNDGVVNGVSWSPDGRFVASADEGEHVQVWDVSTGAWVISLTGHTGSITAVSWSPDGKWIASCGDDRTVRLWKVVNSGIQPGSQVTFWNFGITLTGHRAVVKSLAWSPDSKMLASGDMEGQINIWDIDYILSER